MTNVIILYLPIYTVTIMFKEYISVENTIMFTKYNSVHIILKEMHMNCPGSRNSIKNKT